MSKALVLLSGGQDSTVCLYWAKKHFKEVVALTFDYGQRHKKEIMSAERIAKEAGVECRVLDISNILQLSDSALVNKDKEIKWEEGHLPTSWVPGRNLLFLAVASVIAVGLNILDIVIGVNAIDYSGYPDCRSAFIFSVQKAIQLATLSAIKVNAPLMYLSKREILLKAKELDCFDIVTSDSWTCYEGKEIPCGICPACRLRIEAEQTL